MPPTSASRASRSRLTRPTSSESRAGPGRVRPTCAGARGRAPRAPRTANGFDEVVGRAEVEPADAIGDLAAGRQHQHGQPRVDRAHDREHLEAVHARQHHVQDHQVRRVVAEADERIGARADGLDECPSARRPLATNAAISGSSSTTRMRMREASQDAMRRASSPVGARARSKARHFARAEAPRRRQARLVDPRRRARPPPPPPARGARHRRRRRLARRHADVRRLVAARSRSGSARSAAPRGRRRVAELQAAAAVGQGMLQRAWEAAAAPARRARRAGAADGRRGPPPRDLPERPGDARDAARAGASRRS